MALRFDGCGEVALFLSFSLVLGPLGIFRKASAGPRLHLRLSALVQAVHWARNTWQGEVVCLYASLFPLSNAIHRFSKGKQNSPVYNTFGVLFDSQHCMFRQIFAYSIS
jgi:hypothetical protein